MIVRESINFERGLDPKDSMDIGTPLARLATELGMTYAEIRQDRKDLQEIVAAAINPGDDEDKDYSFAFYAVADDPMAYDISRESRLFDVALWADQHQKDAIRILRTPDRISESVNFERGIDPKKSAKIGLTSPKRFKTIEEFTDHVMAALPLIFGGKIPEDILSKREGGMLPESYYGKIAWWLTENGFEMPNGNNDWEGPIDNAPKGFAFWTTPITQRLEQMLGEKKWSEYN